jgi:hypothetical protein
VSLTRVAFLVGLVLVVLLVLAFALNAAQIAR